MNPFEYIKPTSVADAIAAASQPGAAFFAAGTNLLDLMKLGAMRPSTLVDVTRLPGLGEIEEMADGGFHIGAMVRNADLARDPAFARAYPAVAEALLSGASAQLRNVATVGGNLMQATRCAYFQDPSSACNRRDPGTGCDAREGENRTHAVLGWSDACIATHASDFCVPLVALDAIVEIEGPDGHREVALENFHPLPDGTSAPHSVLRPGELILGLRLPPEASSFRTNSRYLKLRERTSFAFALISASASLRIEDGKILQARLALGAVAARPWRAWAAEAQLFGALPTEENFERAAEVALADAKASGDNGYKIELARRVVKRALMLAVAGTPERMPASPASVMNLENGAVAHV